MTSKKPLDQHYLNKILLDLLAIPCPTGFTDRAVFYVCERLDELGIKYELTRRGTIRAKIEGRLQQPARAITTHLDTIGAMVREIKPSGRLAITPLGHWSSRFAEGARVSIFTDSTTYRGTVLPLFAAGHTYNEAIDTQPVSWDQVEIRVDEQTHCPADTLQLGIDVGDFVSFDPNPEFLDNGFIVSRHLDDKAGTACLLTALKSIQEQQNQLEMDCHAMFTLTEEIGSGAGHAMAPDVTEFVGIDIGPVAQGQNAREQGVTIAMKDSSGPFDYHLSRHLLTLCKQHHIPHQRDVFRFYYSDAVSAVQAGHDIRHALVTFGTDATHGYERTHISTLTALTELLIVYIQSGPAISSDTAKKVPLEDFSKQLTEDNFPSSGTPLPSPTDLL